jgi:N-acetylmuramoyl-L-alanine amidase
MSSLAKRVILFVLIAVLTGAAGQNDKSIPIRIIDGTSYIPLFDLVTVMNLSQTYDPVARRGKIMRKEHQAIYLEDCPRMIIDGQLFTAKKPVIRSSNEILIPAELFDPVADAFFDEYDVTRKSDLYLFQETRSDTTQKPVRTPKKNSARYTAVAAEKIGFIILDAGHGGKDPGAIGKGKLYEKNITLSVVKAVGKIIKQKNPSIKIYYTRSDDTFVELGGRTEFANRKITQESGGVFVSIHVNASIVPKMSGFETYFLSQNPTNEDARSTASLENDVVILENPGRRKSYDDVAYTEALMLTTQIQKESRMLADKIQKSMASSNKEFPSRGVKTADFFVLRGSLMPAALVEIGYITNKKESSRLITNEYQSKIANAVAQGVLSFLSSVGKE